MDETVVLYPAPTFHHLVSVVELGKLIHKHQPEVSITILLPSMPLDDSTTTSSYITNLSHLSFSFISLPPSNEPTPLHSIATNALHVLHTLQTMSHTSTILALVTSAPHENLNTPIPTYCYFTSCASVLAFLLHFPTIHNTTTKSFHDLNKTLLNIPGLPPIPASHMPQPTLHRDTPSYNYFLNSVAGSMLKSKGVIVNSFDFLEPRAIGAITRGAYVPHPGPEPQSDYDPDQSPHENLVTSHVKIHRDHGNYWPCPPVFCIGPLVTNTKDHVRTSHDDASRCLAWLDPQPRGSVVLLCFGSKGVFTEAQLREIAFGLERSNHRFLWVVKSPQGVDTELNLELLLPKGFLERTKERGLVVKSWVPQNAVLGHGAVGGFVTHCGWNSVLEAVRYGVPMVAWPLYAEQRMNSVVMVEEMKVAIGAMSSVEGLVGWEEVERRVRELMESEKVKQRCWEVKDTAKAAWDLGGSSATNFSKLVASWKHS